jgi:hypothetical protein
MIMNPRPKVKQLKVLVIRPDRDFNFTLVFSDAIVLPEFKCRGEIL